jgi:arylsulfatase A-like enzyme
MKLVTVAAVWMMASGACAAQPNIVFFFVDDQGWQDTSEPFYSEVTALNRQYHTPQMQRLAAEGMKFTQAYACAVCSPSRVSLMTGLNAARHQVTCWTLRKDQSPSRRHPKVREPEWNVNGLSAGSGVPGTIQAVTLPMLLRQAGYRTIHVGKAHWGAKGTPGENPRNLGFDVNIAGHAAGGPGSYYGKYNFSAAWRKGDTIWDIPGLEKYHGMEINLTEALTIEARKAMDQAVAEKLPFFLYMSHYAVHAPWEKDDRFYQKYLDAGVTGLGATLASMLEGMDKSLGDILANLRRHGIEDNTIVVFMSDNGAPSQVPRNLPLRGHKLTPYEGGIRVPMIVKWPSVVEAGSTCNAYLIIEDLFPTILEMAGIPFDQEIDGESIVPMLKKQPVRDPERPIFWHYPNTYDQPPYSVVRKGDWKLIYHHVTQKRELFNLHEDIGEKNDLAKTYPDRVAEMSKVLGDYLRSVNAGMPVENSTNKPVPWPDNAR